MGLVVEVLAGRQEVVAVAHRLDHEEERVERKRRDGCERELARRELGRLVVKRGSTRQSVASVATVASAVAVLSALNEATRLRNAPTSTARPRIPLQVITTAAKTVSRASVEVSGPPSTINVTISATSITVTATASASRTARRRGERRPRRDGRLRGPSPRAAARPAGARCRRDGGPTWQRARRGRRAVSRRSSA